MLDDSVEPVENRPPAQTTNSGPGITESVEAASQKSSPPVVGMPARDSRRGPIQELRIAIVFTGGVSLAVWMGGVSREINLLVQASDLLDARDDGRKVDEDFPYLRLLDALNTRVCVDVISGTSAGGINAALLGLANARHGSLDPVRNLWLSMGGIGTLLRDPRLANPPSLFLGDDHLLVELTRGLWQVAGADGPADPRPTDVFITTTLLSPEVSQFTDNYGTVITDADHHGLFHFNEVFMGKSDAMEVAVPLALAARSSASFPGAFEPAFLTCNHADGHAAKDVCEHADITTSHWAADGGLLVNRPIAPLLQQIFDRPSDGRQIRRVLMYVVPSSRPPKTPEPDRVDAPLTLSEALLRDLGATLNQSISADLAAIRDHNDRVAASAQTRLRLAALGVALLAARSPTALAVGAEAGRPASVLTGAHTWEDYRRRQAEWVVRPLIAAVLRHLATRPDLSESWHAAVTAPASDIEQRLRAAARTAVAASWPSAPISSTTTAATEAAMLGRPAYDAAKATVLDLLRAGFVLADTALETSQLAECERTVHNAFKATRESDLRRFVRDELEDLKDQTDLATVVAQLTAKYTGLTAAPEDSAADPRQTGAGAGDAPSLSALVTSLRTAWTELADIVRQAGPQLTQLALPARQPADTAPQTGPPGRPSTRERRADAAYRLSTYLEFLGVDTGQTQDSGLTVARLVDLHVAERSVLPVGVDVEQPVELVQVSADTRTLLAPHRTAEEKLTGMQMHHFGAFYKASWRANDYMWGRIDGAGWLVHLLLDPRRILALAECASAPADCVAIAPTDRPTWFLDRLQDRLRQPPLEKPAKQAFLEELAFLADETLSVPASLPSLALVLAQTIQQTIACDELKSVANAIRCGDDGLKVTLTGPEKYWLQRYDEAARSHPERIAQTLADCPVADQRLGDPQQTHSPLFIHTVTSTVAVATAAVTSLKQTPVTLRPAFSIARTITRTAAMAVDACRGRRGWVIFIALMLLLLGLPAMLTNTLLIGVSGLVLAGAGVLLLAIAIWQGVPRFLGLLLAMAALLVAVAPWMPWLDTRMFSWLAVTAVPWLRHEKWRWTAFFLIALLPVLSLAAGAFRHRGKPSSSRKPRRHPRPCPDSGQPSNEARNPWASG